MKKIVWCMVVATVMAMPVFAQEEEKKQAEPAQKVAKVSKKLPFLTNKLTPSDYELGKVTVSPEGGEGVEGQVKAQRAGFFLLDVDGVFSNKKAPPKKNRVVLIPKKSKKLAVEVKSETGTYPGTVFKGKKGLYRLDINNIFTPRGAYRYQYRPHTFEFALYFGGDSLFSTFHPNQTFFDGFFVFNIYTQNRAKRRNGYSSLVQFRVGYGSAPAREQLTLGVLFGGSQYVFDKRPFDSGIGWSMLVNGGMSFDFSSKLSEDFARYPVTLGAELEFKAIYNFHKYAGITFGMLFGYSFSPDLSGIFGSNSGPKDGDGFPIFDSSRPVGGLVIDQGFRWSFSVGLIF